MLSAFNCIQCASAKGQKYFSLSSKPQLTAMCLFIILLTSWIFSVSYINFLQPSSDDSVPSSGALLACHPSWEAPFECWVPLPLPLCFCSSPVSLFLYMFYTVPLFISCITVAVHIIYCPTGGLSFPSQTQLPTDGPCVVRGPSLPTA